MSINIIDSKENLNNKVVQDFEEVVGVKLPDEYRKFLLLHNGGILEPEMGFKFKSPTNNLEDESMIGFLYSIYDGEYGSLLREFMDYQKYIPTDMLIISNDPGSGLILLGLSGEKRGRVYFWRQEFESIGEYESECKTFALVADSFHIFLELLYPIE